MKKTALILGGGFAGCSSAHLLNKKGFDVTLIEAGPNLGGGCWTHFYGGHPYTFGPRVFFTNDEPVIAQITSLVDIRKFYTKTWTYVESDSQMYHYPLQYSDIPLMPDKEKIEAELDKAKAGQQTADDFENYWISAIGPTLYEKFVNNYSKKMWGVESNKQLLANWEWVNRGVPIRDGDDRLYNDQFQGYPSDINGYNSYFTKCVKDCTVHMKTRVEKFDPEKRVVTVEGKPMTADVIVNTVHVDALFGWEYGKLQFCGRQFIPIWLPSERVFPEDVTWIHYSGKEEHTRITEFKNITGFKSDSTLLGIEIPTNRGRYYPVQSKPELERFESYKKMFPKNFYSVGRLGKFKYQGIPDAIRDAIDIAAEI